MIKFTWKQSDLAEKLRNVHINGQLRAKCHKDEFAYNWLYTVATTWAQGNRSIDAHIAVPDQLHDYLGMKTIHLVRVDDDELRIMI